MIEYLNELFSENTGGSWLMGFAAFGGMILLVKMFRAQILRRLRKVADRTTTTFDNLMVDLLDQVHAILIFALALAALLLVLEPADDWIMIRTLLILALILQAMLWVNTIINFYVGRYKERRMAEDAAAVTTVSAFAFLIKIAIYVLLVVLLLSNLEINVGSLLAGVGIAGIAIGLAVQNVLSDLFASLSIILDRPFVIGDFIIVDDKMGTVENIGLKTTRVRSLAGEQLVFSNNDLLSSRIQNYKRMFERRIVFTFGVVYQTPADKLERIGGMVRETIEQTGDTRFDRAHFKSFGDSSLDFEVVYFVLNPDYNLYMDIQQRINLALFRRFEQEGIDFAYPTRTLHVEGGPLESKPQRPPRRRKEEPPAPSPA